MIELIVRYDGSYSITDSVLVVGKTIGVLVRCKDCRYGRKTTPIESGENIECEFCDWEYFEDDFCSRGERKDNG